MASRAASITSQLSCHALGSSCSLCRSGGADFCVRLNVLKPALPRTESQNKPLSPLCVCVLQCWSESPDFWSRDLAVTASDDRGSGEIAPGTPEEAHISGSFQYTGHKCTDRWSQMMPLFFRSHCSVNASKDHFLKFFFACAGLEC